MTETIKLPRQYRVQAATELSRKICMILMVEERTSVKRLVSATQSADGDVRSRLATLYKNKIITTDKNSGFYYLTPACEKLAQILQSHIKGGLNYFPRPGSPGLHTQEERQNAENDICI